mgnify:CR=1 FL=1
MNDLFELNFHPNQQELTHGNGPEEGEGPTSSTSASTQDALANSSARWRQIPPVSGGMAVHRFCHVGAIYKGMTFCPIMPFIRNASYYSHTFDSLFGNGRISVCFWRIRWEQPTQ